MKRLDTLLDELQHPVAQLMDWCKSDQDRAIFAALRDLLEEKSTCYFDVLLDAYPDCNAGDITSIAHEIIDYIENDDHIANDGLEFIDYEKLYSPLEHIINDRIDLYNRS